MKYTIRFYNQYGECEAEVETALLQTFLEFVVDYLDAGGWFRLLRAEDGALEVHEPMQEQVEA